MPVVEVATKSEEANTSDRVPTVTFVGRGLCPSHHGNSWRMANHPSGADAITVPKARNTRRLSIRVRSTIQCD